MENVFPRGVFGVAIIGARGINGRLCPGMPQRLFCPSWVSK